MLLYQGVTLGGTGKEKGKRHPTIGNNVMIGAGARVLGPFKVGDNPRIASNAVVLNEIPADSTRCWRAGRVVRVAGKKVNFSAEVDQIHITDPVSVDLSALRDQVELLERYLIHNSHGEEEHETV